MDCDTTERVLVLHLRLPSSLNEPDQVAVGNDRPLVHASTGSMSRAGDSPCDRSTTSEDSACRAGSAEPRSDQVPDRNCGQIMATASTAAGGTRKSEGKR